MPFCQNTLKDNISLGQTESIIIVKFTLSTCIDEPKITTVNINIIHGSQFKLARFRWFTDHIIIQTIVSTVYTLFFRVVVTSLDELARDYGDTKAAGYSRSIQNFEFIVTLVAVEHALSGLVNLSKLLQKKSCDLIEASDEARVVTTMIEVCIT